MDLNPIAALFVCSNTYTVNMLKFYATISQHNDGKLIKTQHFSIHLAI